MEKGRSTGVIVNIEDLRERAEKRLPKAIFQYVDGGAYDEVTLKRNRADLDALALNERVMVDVSHLETAATLLGDPASMPMALAPVGMCGATWPNGEVEAAKAAEARGLPFCLSLFSICSMEDVAAAIKRPFWQQLYMMKDRAVNEHVIERAVAAGCSALVMTLDVHVHSQRWADNRNGLVAPLHIMPANTLDMMAHLPWIVRMLASKHHTFANMAPEHPEAKWVIPLAEWINDCLDNSIDQDTIRWVRSLWPRKLVLKGIMTVDDARRAADLGADAIVVSNHGGRQLDSAPSTISVLPAIARAVGDQIEVLWDGGLRNGFDIIKARGRGAHGCLSGRAWVYGLAWNGREGVDKALGILRQELLDGMALSGFTDLRNVPDGLVSAQPAL
jgi:L-lactate dehydrogenase (cytochrome)